jgi:hypothetical protein
LPRARLVVADLRAPVAFDLLFAVAMRLDSTPYGSGDSISDSWPLPARRTLARRDCYDVRLFQKETSMAKAKGRAVNAWSKEDVKNLRAFAKEKLSAARAAKKLRRTRGAVAQKAMKLGIRFRSIRRKAR